MDSSAVLIPKFDFDEVRYAVDPAMFERAKKLFKTGVRNFQANERGYSAEVKGSTDWYFCSVSSKTIMRGLCDCYMGQNGELCKHAVAVALVVLHRAGLINDHAEPNFKISSEQEAKKMMSSGLRRIIGYSGPSSTWFEYQTKLEVAAGKIKAACDYFEPSADNAKYLWSCVMKISQKLANGGVDDSNGIVGRAAIYIARNLAKWGDDPAIRVLFKDFKNQETNFDFGNEPFRDY